MDQPVQDGIGHRGIIDQRVPLGDGKLAGHQRSPLAVTVIEDLQQVSVLFARDRGQTKIINDQ